MKKSHLSISGYIHLMIILLLLLKQDGCILFTMRKEEISDMLRENL